MFVNQQSKIITNEHILQDSVQTLLMYNGCSSPTYHSSVAVALNVLFIYTYLKCEKLGVETIYCTAEEFMVLVGIYIAQLRNSWYWSTVNNITEYCRKKIYNSPVLCW